MELIPNGTFHLIRELTPSTQLTPGIYRVIFDAPTLETTVAVLISPEGANPVGIGGRSRKSDTALRTKRRKPPPSLVGKLLWLNRSELATLSEEGLMRSIELQRARVGPLCPRGIAEMERRKTVMASLLDLEVVRESVLIHKSLGPLIARAVKTHGVSRTYVYRQWSNLCLWGFDEQSLTPRRDRCGAPGVPRPCDPGGRKKAGRRTEAERIAREFGRAEEPAQPGISSEWAAAIRAADKQIPSPKPSWSTRGTAIINSAFCRATDDQGRVVRVRLGFGEYPNDQQIKRVLTEGKSLHERLLEQTTKRHFEAAKRGLIARNWKGVAGPGHTWEIDSTIGDMYLRSSVDRAWILGRPVAYIIVDVWSTAVVGFYVCIAGPSWKTAKVSLFNAVADPHLVGELWGYEPILTLNPLPTMCYTLHCDRGEYLSSGHRVTATKLLPHTSYAPPYRGDLKGLVEVLHRIEKDAQYLFIPGAMDYRREELELRKVNPEECVFTVREYVQYLHELFAAYNLTADRSNRLDAHMLSAGVMPSPAGLWHWGHAMGIGYRRHTPQEDLITELLPHTTARVRRDAIRYAGCDYSGPEVELAQWTTLARNRQGWDVPAYYYPGTMQSIWTPNPAANGLVKLTISQESRAAPTLTREEWTDCIGLQRARRPETAHLRKMIAVDTRERMEALKAHASRLTSEAIARSSGASPTITQAKAIELAATTPSCGSESKATATLQDEAMDAYESMMDALLQSDLDEGD